MGDVFSAKNILGALVGGSSSGGGMMGGGGGGSMLKYAAGAAGVAAVGGAAYMAYRHFNNKPGGIAGALGGGPPQPGAPGQGFAQPGFGTGPGAPGQGFASQGFMASGGAPAAGGMDLYSFQQGGGQTPAPPNTPQQGWGQQPPGPGPQGGYPPAGPAQPTSQPAAGVAAGAAALPAFPPGSGPQAGVYPPGTAPAYPPGGGPAAAPGSGPAAAQAGPPTQASPASAAQEESDALLLVRAMIAAAAVDGQIDDKERASILQRLETAGLGPEDRAALEAEMASPKPVRELLAGVRDAEMAKQFYLVSLLAVTIDSDAEKNYLKSLPMMLGLGQPDVDGVHQLLGMPPIS